MTVERFMTSTRPTIRIVLADVRGSAPRDAGTQMFVTATETLGTIGGGQLEHIAIEAARKLIAAGDLATELDIPLGPEIGQCCGGRVSVSLMRMSEADKSAAIERATADMQARPHIYIMGGGHVGRALANLFQHLPFRAVLVDGREAELALCTASVEKRLSAIPELAIKIAPPGSAFIVLTHDHALDFLLTSAALDRGDAAYVGLIGSPTKRVKFEAWHRQNSSASSLETLVCPIGEPQARDKRPEVIAALVVAEVVAAVSSRQRANPLCGSSAMPNPARDQSKAAPTEQAGQRE